ncbi:MAG: phage tail tape measure protein [Clostridia bacterium]|nr:phage tail tape measure protein [Clostridia bacterium]
MSNFTANITAKLDVTEVEKKLSELNAKNPKITITADGTTAQKEVDNVDKAVVTATKDTETFGTKIKQAFSSYLGFRLVREAFEKITEAVKDADEAITNLREATGDSYSETQKLVSAYTKLGQSLGATTEEVADSADEWLRQGKSVADTNTLIRDAMILSKVGQIDSADATEYLTSAMKGYNIEANEAISIIDKLSAVDMVSATDAGGLAEAMSKVAVTADTAGVSMDKLLGYIAAVGEVTQDSMSSIGNFYKTVFTRMSDIKSGKLELVDEDGTVESLSDVETTLKNVGIDLRSTLTEYNNYGDVLDALAAKWDSLSQVQQNALTKAFAGTRQSERFRVLMENYDTAIEYANTAAESAGTAEEKFNAYMDSIEAKTKSLQAAFEALATDTVSTETVGNIIDATTALVNFIDETHLLEGTIAGAGVYALVKAFTLLRTGVLSAYTNLNSFNNALKMVKAGNIGEKQIQ